MLIRTGTQWQPVSPALEWLEVSPNPGPEDLKVVASLTDPKIAHKIASIALKTARHLKRYLAGNAFALSR